MEVQITVSEIPRRPDTYLREHFELRSNISSFPGVLLRKARIKSSDEKVLVRVIPRASIHRDEDINRILIEINILTNLNYPNIGKLYDFFQDLKGYYLVLQRFHGESLSAKLIKSNKFSESLCNSYMREIFTILQYLDNHKIAFRAIKLENFIFSSKAPDAVIKIVNFYYASKAEDGVVLTEKLGAPFYMSPETIRKSYSRKSDWWSAGVLMYIILSGTPPFLGNSELEIFRNVCDGVLRFPERNWSHISGSARDLIQRLIKLDPNQRLSPTQALEHNWFKESLPSTPNPEASLNYIINLAQLRSHGMLKKLVFRYMSNFFLNQEESEELLNIFKFLDTNKNGVLSRDEIRQGLLKLYGRRLQNLENQLDNIFAEVDFDGSGDLNYHEFLAAAIGRQKLLANEKLQSIFRNLDTNMDHRIEVNELKSAFMKFGIKDESAWEQMIREVDVNKDGVIDLNEFCNLMLK